jgi:isoleucyl-tRNA synthetase
MFKNLTEKESVHLEDFPTAEKDLIDLSLEEEMQNARLIVESAHALRKNAEIKVRIPIRTMKYQGPSEISAKVLEVIKAEINAYELTFDKKADTYLTVADTSDNNLDINFGLARDIIRKIQEERKNLQTSQLEKVTVTMPFWPVEHEEYIKKKALISKIVQGDSFSVTKDE